MISLMCASIQIRVQSDITTCAKRKQVHIKEYEKSLIDNFGKNY